MQRYSDTVTLIKRGKRNEKRSYETMYYPTFPLKPTDLYIITKRGQRLDFIAYEYYQDPRFWWILHRANNITAGTLCLQPGTRLRIPYPLSSYEIDETLQEMQY